ncbi:hypothetical protein [Streptomyces sp. NBRC 109706]|uniref:hypothetical protein n=1 Tax=Streptomyces sp. NBRC 109706 TaxID=1550035 RepID=UPI000783DAFE|nr:hypothetical protein [Streptomyces sp. NBRC 109706]
MDATAVTTAPAVAVVPVHTARAVQEAAAGPSARSRARADARAAAIASRRQAALALQEAVDRRDNGGAVAL